MGVFLRFDTIGSFSRLPLQGATIHFTLDIRKTHYQCGRVPESTYVVASDHGVFSKVGVEMLNLIEMSIKVCFTEQRADLMCFQ